MALWVHISEYFIALPGMTGKAFDSAMRLKMKLKLFLPLAFGCACGGQKDDEEDGGVWWFQRHDARMSLGQGC